MAAFIGIAFLLGRIEPLILVLFFVPGTTNSLIFAPQHFIGLMLLAGVLARRKERESGSQGSC
jgi:hypothetical protein